jgi:hypothetical protein
MRPTLVQNGSFEIFSPSSGVGGFIPRIPQDATLANWTVDSNGALLISNYHWPAADGSWSLNLGRFGPGTITQSISGLQVGTEYLLSFNYAINPFGTPQPPYSFKVTLGDFAYTVTDANADPRVSWQNFSMAFIFGGSNNLTFTSLQNSPDGSQPVLDNVRLTATPLPAALPLFGTALIGGGIIAWRKKRKQKAEAIAA